MQRRPRNQRIILLNQIQKNMEEIRKIVPAQARILAVVKADGYGHGALETSQRAIAGGADWLAVASVSEGVSLRHGRITVPILVLGAVTADDVEDGVRYDLVQTVCSPEMVCLCEEAARKLSLTAKVHLKIDSGMGRIGARTREEIEIILNALSNSPHVILTGAFTHFSDADGDDEGIKYTYRQFERFMELSSCLPDKILRHCANSAAIHRFPEMALDMVRVGISLYGYPPVPENPLGLKPCMRWSAKISYIKTMPEGEYISYGRTYRTPERKRIATITCGYADGYHRAAGPEAEVLIRGKRAKVVGRICMDQMLADITDIPEAKEEDEVVLIGSDGSEQITAEDIAGWAGTISYEILLSVGSRVERVFDDCGADREGKSNE